MNSGERALSSKEWMLQVFRYYARFNAINRTYQFWIQDNHPAEAYLYSSARNYIFENEGCLLELDLLEPYLPGSSFVYLLGFDDQL